MTKVHDIKRAQKESLLLRTLSELYQEASLDDPLLNTFFINRVGLSSDKSTCFVYFYCSHGESAFEKALNHLKLYKPSMRKALAQKINGRYVPELVFVYDNQLSTQIRVESLIEVTKENS